MKKWIYQRAVLALGVAVSLTVANAYAQTSSDIEDTDAKSSIPSASQSRSEAGISTSGTVNSGARDHALTGTDQGLNARIREALNRDSKLRDASSSVILDSRNGDVTLNGTVATEKEKKDLETELQGITGVNEVQNELLIAPRPSNPKLSSATQDQ